MTSTPTAVGNLGVALGIARIRGEILTGSELGRVDEDRHHDEVGVRARSLHQRSVPVVEVAHRRDESD